MVEKIEFPNKIWFRSSISWGAIVGGWLFAFALALLFYLCGAAIGVTSMAAINQLSAGVTVATAAWIIISWVVATFCGAIFAGRLSGITNKGAGVMHGMLVWALSGVMTLFIGSIQAAATVTAIGAAGQGIMAVGQQTTQAGTRVGGGFQIPEEIRQSTAQQLKSQMADILAQMPGTEGIQQQEFRQAIEQLDNETLTTLAGQLIRGETQQAQQTLAANTTLSSSQVNRIVNGLEQAGQNYLGGIAQGGRQAVEQAGDYSGAALWIFFLCSLLGLGAGAWGGLIGASLAAGFYGREMPGYRDYPYTEEQQRAV